VHTVHIGNQIRNLGIKIKYLDLLEPQRCHHFREYALGRQAGRQPIKSRPNLEYHAL
jgi:hypothetical protein